MTRAATNYGALEAFLPVEMSSASALRYCGAFAATLVAGLELARRSAITLEQAETWSSIMVT